MLPEIVADFLVGHLQAALHFAAEQFEALDLLPQVFPVFLKIHPLGAQRLPQLFASQVVLLLHVANGFFHFRIADRQTQLGGPLTHERFLDETLQDLPAPAIHGHRPQAFLLGRRNPLVHGPVQVIGSYRLFVDDGGNFIEDPGRGRSAKQQQGRQSDGNNTSHEKILMVNLQPLPVDLDDGPSS